MNIKSLFLLFAIAGCALGATIQSTTAFDRDNANKPIPRHANGFTIFYDRTDPSVAVYDRKGQQKFATKLEVPGAAKLSITDLTISSDGRLVVAAWAADLPGQLGASLLVWMNPDGSLDKVVRTEGFALRRILFRPDGSLLALGQPQNNPSDGLVRQYRADGMLVRSMAPLGAFASTKATPNTEALLTSTRGGFGIYSRATNIYTEFGDDGQLVGSWPIPLPSATDITGIGVSTSGTLFLGGYSAASGAGRVFRLDRLTKAVEELALPWSGPNIIPATMLAVEEDSLILYRRPSSIVRVLP